jgi:branched-chain amino acid transport system substrate-binding protein
LGAENLCHPINVICDNHEGEGHVTFQQRDGKNWNVVSDWIAPDWALLRPIITKSSKAHAAEKGLPIRTAEDAGKVN